ncbi:MAG: isopenicillin N synthase family oxygenase [Acidimicrobiaceae bacterium]|nr:isopenicillin N synthase family oxygenase [Acidimicrobiaceae bacterium]
MSTHQSVPTLDLEPWWEGTATERESVAAQLDNAATSVGFMQLSGHRIPPPTIDAMVTASATFFDLSMQQKLAARPVDLATNRGYAPPFSEGLAYSLGEESIPDSFEAFNIGEDDVDVSDPFFAAEKHRFFAPNVWPDSPADLRRALVEYFAEARRVAMTLTDVFALALGLGDGWFRPYVDRSTTTMRIINYERVAENPTETTGLGMGAHTDYGVVTVLWSDGHPGLEVLGSDGTWWQACADPGNLLVNLGDMTAEWTNDRWKSTLHRVLPPSAVGVDRRQSTAFFFDANWDARIECLPTCVSADNPPRYPAVLAGEHLLAKLMGPRELRASAATNTAVERITDTN